MQYFDLAYLYYMGYYSVASSLLFVTVSSAFISTAELCKTQQELFKSVDRQRLIPLVQNGRIRSGPLDLVLLLFVGLLLTCLALFLIPLYCFA